MKQLIIVSLLLLGAAPIMAKRVTFTPHLHESDASFEGIPALPDDVPNVWGQPDARKLNRAIKEILSEKSYDLSIAEVAMLQFAQQFEAQDKRVSIYSPLVKAISVGALGVGVGYLLYSRLLRVQPTAIEEVATLKGEVASLKAAMAAMAKRLPETQPVPQSAQTTLAQIAAQASWKSVVSGVAMTGFTTGLAIFSSTVPFALQLLAQYKMSNWLQRHLFKTSLESVETLHGSPMTALGTIMQLHAQYEQAHAAGDAKELTLAREQIRDQEQTLATAINAQCGYGYYIGDDNLKAVLKQRIVTLGNSLVMLMVAIASDHEMAPVLVRMALQGLANDVQALRLNVMMAESKKQAESAPQRQQELLQAYF